jgi:transposase
MEHDNWRHFVGVDWASSEHEVCALDAAGQHVDARAFKHSGDGLADLCTWLLKLGEPATIAVAIEVPHGAVVETLLDRGFAVFSINPKQLDRFRDRFTMPGAKDDRRDAMVLAASLRTDTHLFRRLAIQPAVVIELREWSRMHDELQSDRNGLVNQMRAQFARYFPAFLETVGDPGEDWAIRLFEVTPTPEAAAKAKASKVTKVLKDHRIRRLDADQALQQLRQRPVFSAPGTAPAATAHLRLLGERVLLVNEQLRRCKQRLEELLEQLGTGDNPGQTCEQRDVAIILSIPGIGMIVASTLLGEAAEPLAARDYRTLRALAGVAPVTRRSGKRHSVSMRAACHPRLRNAIYHWARVAAMHDPISKTRYKALRVRGKPHGQALRCVADRLLAVLCAMLRNRTDFRVTPEPQAA